MSTSKEPILKEAMDLIFFLGNNDLKHTLHAFKEELGYPSVQENEVDFMSPSYKDIIFAIMEFLNNNGFKHTLHALEEESGVFFERNRLEKLLVDGKWRRAEGYLAAFIQPEDSVDSWKIFNQLERQAIADTAASHETERAELHYRRTTRAAMVATLKPLIEAVPDLNRKPKFSDMNDSRLQTLRNQRLRKNFCPQHNPQVKADPVINKKRNFSDMMNDSRLEQPSLLRIWRCSEQHSGCTNPVENPQVSQTCDKPENETASDSEISAGIDILELNLPRIRVERRTYRNFTELNNPTQLCSLQDRGAGRLKITSLQFSNFGTSLYAVAEKGRMLWTWTNRPNQNASTAVLPIVSRLCKNDHTGFMLYNEEINRFSSYGCIGDKRAVSAIEGKVAIILTKANMTASVIIDSPPPAAKCIVFLPLENTNIIVMGYDDNSILLYNCQNKRVINKMVGHSKSITGLASSANLDVLVSAGADSRLVLWGMKRWEYQRSCFVDGSRGEGMTNTRVQFSPKGARLLVIHDLFLAIYDGSILECDCKWEPGNFPHTITEATFSANGNEVFCIFSGCVIGIFITNDLYMARLIKPEAYLQNTPSRWLALSAVAGHPTEDDMLAVGLNDGKIVLLELMPTV